MKKREIEKMINACNTLEELKKAYKKLAFATHPDRGGSTELFQYLGSVYEKKFKALQMNTENKQEKKETPSTFKDIIDNLISIIPTGITITVEIRGSWLWIAKENSKEVYSIKEKIKEIGFQWSTKNKQWFNPLVDNFKKTKAHYKKNAREKYGCSTTEVEGKATRQYSLQA